MARFFAENWEDYELIDAGNNQKLERWGNVVTIRPERNAYFTPVLSLKEWKKEADFIFNEVSHTKGDWKVLNANAPTEWKISYKNLIFNLKLTKFKHVGLFPEQVFNWDFISSKLSTSSRFLNLFGYTGGASLMARKSGAEVYHCDSVRQINAWAKTNMEDSSLDHIRWVLDDALKFAQRELKRGNKYDGIIMDPPAFGIGAKKERWKIEDKFPELLETTTGLLVNNGFLIANTYSPRLDAKKIKAYTSSVVKGKTIEIGTLSRKTTTGKILEYGELTRIY
ncbi:class I SAM-dependent methyltransferase [Crocinitomix algicola]|uniref:class I SAM-dependent methyltransferase n=1 Tax=Crocinitomix algicola TaxID=1740263 RepID=UPI0008729650|nr:class I SAM-dependent methyltransferase [Crocinitomix algicola]